MSDLLTGLNPQQQKAVTTTDGPVLVLAGAGSGKTKTLVHRIAYLIKERGVKPENILAVTFTNKAAGEVKERVGKLLSIAKGPVAMQPTIGTFHSICVRMLRQYAPLLGYKNSFNIYDDEDTKNLIKQILLDKDISPKKFSPNIFYGMIERAKNELRGPKDMDADGYIGKLAVEVYEQLQERLREQNAFDFGDLIMKVVELLQAQPKVLQACQDRWKYILVDEYQDTNHAQYQWVTLLAKKHKQIYVVGDDAQSIYLFRGADIGNILHFEQDYPEAVVIPLEQNYRSTQNILNASNAVILENKNQKHKVLWTENPVGEPVRVAAVADEHQEVEYILAQIAKDAGVIGDDGYAVKTRADQELTYEPEEETLLSRVEKSYRQRVEERAPGVRNFLYGRIAEKINLNRYAILYRTNAQSRVLEEVFLLHGVPYRIIGGLRFYERREIKDVIAYLRLLSSPEDWLSAQRIIATPARGIGDKSFASLWQMARTNKLDFISAAKQAGELGLPSKSAESIQRFGLIMSDLRVLAERERLTGLMDALLVRVGYKEHLLDGTEAGESRWENVQELKTVAAKFDDRPAAEGLLAFLEEVALFSDLDEQEKAGVQAVTMMTLHSAKGLEFPTVFLVGVEEGLFPHSQSINEPAHLEEERRLAYVGMTRAEQKLYMIYTAKRELFGKTLVNMPSRFLKSLPEDGVEWVG